MGAIWIQALVCLCMCCLIQGQFTLTEETDCMYTFHVSDVSSDVDCPLQADIAESMSLLKTTLGSLQAQVSALTTQSALFMDQLDVLETHRRSMKDQLQEFDADASIRNKTLTDLFEVRSSLVDKLNHLQDEFSESAEDAGGGVNTDQGSVGSCENMSSGTVYTHWGATSCPSTATELIYQGQAASSGDSHAGGGGEILCVPHSPQWAEYAAGFQLLTARLNGAVFGSSPLMNTSDGSNLNGQAVPCGVCYVQPRANTLMLPSRTSCPVGWTREYHGYLLAAATSNQRSTYVCVDENVESQTGSTSTSNKATLDHVEAACGVLDCPNYVSGREITCAVCTL